MVDWAWLSVNWVCHGLKIRNCSPIGNRIFNNSQIRWQKRFQWEQGTDSCQKTCVQVCSVGVCSCVIWLSNSVFLYQIYIGHTTSCAATPLRHSEPPAKLHLQPIPKPTRNFGKKHAENDTNLVRSEIIGFVDSVYLYCILKPTITSATTSLRPLGPLQTLQRIYLLTPQKNK